jgi:hypothetical protein
VNDVEQLRQLIGQRLDQSDATAALRFSEVNRWLEGLTEQVKETNGRVRHHEAVLAGLQPEVKNLGREMGEVKKSRRTLMDDLKANAMLIVSVIVATISFTVAVLGFLGKLR